LALTQLAGSSNITSIIFEDADIDPAIFEALLRVPKVLKSLSVSQDLHCYSFGSCSHPHFKSLGETLRVHKDSLEELDLDLFVRTCKQKGHPSNPNAVPDEMTGIYKSNPGIRAGSYWIGSLKEFTVLKSLSIDVTALCGDQNWGAAPQKLVEILPESLEALNLYIKIISYSKWDAEPRVLEFPNKLDWRRQVIALVKSAETKHPKLKKLIFTVPNIKGYTEADHGWMFTEVRETCSKCWVDYQLVKVMDGPFTHVNIKAPYFQKIDGSRSPGREY